MNAQPGLRKTLLQVQCLLDRMALGNGSKTREDGVFGHVAVPLQNINEMAVLINDGC